MVVGAVLGLTQTDLKRMLAYSSIAHAGFLLTGVLGLGAGGEGRAWRPRCSTCWSTGSRRSASFALLTLVRDGDGEATHLSQWAGLAQRSPLTAAVMSLFLLALAGIPLTSGFTASSRCSGRRSRTAPGRWSWWRVLASAVAAFFYLRVIVLMYFSPPGGGRARPSACPGCRRRWSLAITATATVVLGIVPGPVLDLARAGGYLRRLMTGARAAVERHLRSRPRRRWHRGSTPASTIGPWLPEGELGDVAGRGAGRASRRR